MSADTRLEERGVSGVDDLNEPAAFSGLVKVAKDALPEPIADTAAA